MDLTMTGLEQKHERNEFDKQLFHRLARQSKSGASPSFPTTLQLSRSPWGSFTGFLTPVAVFTEPSQPFVIYSDITSLRRLSFSSHSKPHVPSFIHSKA